MTILDTLLHRKHILVRENERVLATYKGNVLGIYGAGVHTLPNRHNLLEIFNFNLSNRAFSSAYEKALFEKLPSVAEQHLAVFQTNANEVLIIEREGLIAMTLAPDHRITLWKDAGPWKETRIDVSETLDVDETLMRRLGQARLTDLFTVHVIAENHLGFLFINGVLSKTLAPGTHGFWNVGKDITIKTADLRRQSLDVNMQEIEKALFEKLPSVAEQHLAVFQTNANEVLIIEREGLIAMTLAPDHRITLWKDAGPWEETRIDVSASLDVDEALTRRLGQARLTDLFTVHVVAENHVGLLFINGVLSKTLAPGTHGFWNVGKSVVVKMVDLRRQSLDVNAQEMLTRDCVTIRVNISANYRIVDPIKAIVSVKDFSEALYRALQFAFRQVISTMTLDQLLERQVTVNDETTQKVRSDMAELGIEVLDIDLKDVILPGDMRDILNKVVAAQKEAEANVIRRREETNATRSLLNTAKVMAENPVMLRLKELEALETIADKVNQLTIHNGTEGLLNNLVKLRDH